MDAKIDRRALMALGLAGTAGACAPCPDFIMPPPGRMKVGDAHTHLFNASDLPVGGFMRDVLAPVYLDGFPEVVPALVDIALKVLKFFSMSAEQELRERVPPWRGPSTEPVSAEAFASRVAGHMEAEIARGGRETGPADPENDLADSHRALALVIASAGAQQEQQEQDRNPDRVDRAALSRIARLGAAVVPPGGTVRMMATRERAARELDAVDVMSIIRWAFLMVQPRCSHLHKYLAFAEGSGEAEVKVMINLLVDYDKWLDDAPARGSWHDKQVSFWTSYSRAVRERVDIHSFAGFDPLKHAEQAARGQTGYLEELRGWFTAGPDAPHKVSGFKVYPPMGFRVIGNARREPRKDRAGARVEKYWKDDPVLKAFDLNTRLDASLDAFFDMCCETGAPVMTHARHSNEASTGSGADASLKYWHARAERQFDKTGKKLRACMGHIDDSNEGGNSYRHWLPRLLELNAQGRAEIYFDIGYTLPILNGRAVWFFNELHGLGGSLQIEKYLMFGTDWIMLAQEPDAGDYYKKAIAAVNASKFAPYKDLLFGGNLRTFLNLPAQSASVRLTRGGACRPTSRVRTG